LELSLGNGRRADVIGVSAKAEIWIVETKSGLEDYWADAKWRDYLDYCDAFYFGVTEHFPGDCIPQDVGVIVADGFGGEIIRPAPGRALAPARRRALLIDYARTAATRLFARQ
jgi:hypothetical protein